MPKDACSPCVLVTSTADVDGGELAPVLTVAPNCLFPPTRPSVGPMSATIPTTAAVPKVRRVRVYTRLSQPLRKRLTAYCAAAGRSERAVIEEAVGLYLSGTSKDTSTRGPLDRLVEAFDQEQRQRERQHRDIEILSEAFARFLRLWTVVHAPTFNGPTSATAEAVSKLRADGEALYKRVAASIAEQFLSGHRFVHDLPKLDDKPSERARKP